MSFEKKQKVHVVVCDGRGGRTVHLALVREDDLPAAAGRVDGQGLMEALLDVGAPHALRIALQGLVECVPQLLAPTPGGGSRHPLRRRGGTTERGARAGGGWRVLGCGGSGGGGGEMMGESAVSVPGCMKSTDEMMVWMWKAVLGKERRGR